MKITAKYRGVTTEHDIKPPEDLITKGKAVTAVVMQPGIKVDAPDAYKITPASTVECMAKMSQKAWEHISTGPLFKHFFFMLFGEDAWLPEKIEDLNDEDTGTIHGCGLIIMLVEARFDNRKEVFIETPENSLHPKQQQMLMSVIYEIQKIPLGGGEDDMLVQVMG
jgi:hypothetical protein